MNDGNSGNNYLVAYVNNTTNTISKAALTIGTLDVTKLYDATTSASGTPVAVGGTLYTNASNGNIADSLSGGTYAFTTASIGTGKTVLVGGVTVNDGNGGNNYNAIYANNTNSSITGTLPPATTPPPDNITNVVASVTYGQKQTGPQNTTPIVGSAPTLNATAGAAPSAGYIFDVSPSLNFETLSAITNGFIEYHLSD